MVDYHRFDLKLKGRSRVGTISCCPGSLFGYFLLEMVWRVGLDKKRSSWVWYNCAPNFTGLQEFIVRS